MLLALQPPTGSQQAAMDQLMERQIKRHPPELMERPQAMVHRRMLMRRGRLLMDQVDNSLLSDSLHFVHL